MVWPILGFSMYAYCTRFRVVTIRRYGGLSIKFSISRVKLASAGILQAGGRTLAVRRLALAPAL